MKVLSPFSPLSLKGNLLGQHRHLELFTAIAHKSSKVHFADGANRVDVRAAAVVFGQVASEPLRRKIARRTRNEKRKHIPLRRKIARRTRNEKRKHDMFPTRFLKQSPRAQTAASMQRGMTLKTHTQNMLKCTSF